jgi:hypothetical protein
MNKDNVIAAAKKIRKLWIQKPVANDPDWHYAVLELIQALSPTKPQPGSAPPEPKSGQPPTTSTITRSGTVWILSGMNVS